MQGVATSPTIEYLLHAVDEILDGDSFVLVQLISGEGANSLQGGEEVAPVVGQAARQRPAGEDLAQRAKGSAVAPRTNQLLNILDDVRRRQHAP